MQNTMSFNLDFETAVFLLQKYRNKIKLIACLDPDFILIDSKKNLCLRPIFFTFEEGDNFFYHPFHESRIPGTEFYDIHSAYPYGGPVATTTDFEFLRKVWDAHKAYCKNKNIVGEFIRFHPLLENWKYYQGDVFDYKKTIYVDLKSDDLIASYKENRTRTACRKAIKNNIDVKFYKPQDFQPIFRKLYIDSMRRLQAKTAYFFNDEYLHDICYYKNAWLSVAFHQDEILSALISLVGGNILELYLVGSSGSSSRLCAPNLIYHRTLERAKDEGLETAHFGGATNNNPKDPLFFFKSGFSDKTAEYKIGKFIHNKIAFDEMTCCDNKEKISDSWREFFYR